LCSIDENIVTLEKTCLARTKSSGNQFHFALTGNPNSKRELKFIMVHDSPFSIRRIVEPDNLEIAKVIRDCLIEFGANGPGYAWQDPELDEMYQAYQRLDSVFLVVEQLGANGARSIVGGGGIAPLAGCDTKDAIEDQKRLQEKVCELQKMYFAPSARGKGLGEKILLMLLEEAKSLGFTQCYLETLKRMDAANGLYRKMGFQAVDSPIGNTGHCSCDYWYLKQL